jgi:hypothetical protein
LKTETELVPGFNQQFPYRRHGERSGQWLIASSAQAVDLPV